MAKITAVLPSRRPCLYEWGFSVMTEIKNKKPERLLSLKPELRLALSNSRTRIKKLSEQRYSDFTAFKLEQGATYAPLYMLERVIELFVQNKNSIDHRHEYALMTIEKNDVNWVKGFSNNPNNIVNVLQQKDISESEVSGDFDLSCILETVIRNVGIPEPNNPLHIPPPYVVRLINIYSRSSCTFVDRKQYKISYQTHILPLIRYSLMKVSLFRGINRFLTVCRR